MSRKNSKQLSNLELLSGLIGVSPIPIAGEICGTLFFYRILKETSLAEKKPAGIILAASVNGLVRLSLYTSIYSSFYKKIAEYIQ